MSTSAICLTRNRSHFLRYRKASRNTSETLWMLVEEKIPVQDLPQEKSLGYFLPGRIPPTTKTTFTNDNKDMGSPTSFHSRNTRPTLKFSPKASASEKYHAASAIKGPSLYPHTTVTHVNTDFDLCQTCYDCGMHCDDDEHMLVELGKVGSWIVPRWYHSCANGPAGERDVIDL